MLSFPNCKINLGLRVLEKRKDGFHNIETVFYPVNWCDALEIIENPALQQPLILHQSGAGETILPAQNLVFKACELVRQKYSLPPLEIYLQKAIPSGAGLGGGSSDAAFTINMLNLQFGLGMKDSEREEMASQIGSDCAFFIKNTAVLARGRGNEFSKADVDLRRYYIALLHPQVHSNTAEAYAGIRPHTRGKSVADVIVRDIKDWKDELINDFEPVIFKKFPVVKELKQSLYDAGALYAAMSGSGSAVFGIFDQEPELKVPSACRFHLQKPALDECSQFSTR